MLRLLLQLFPEASKWATPVIMVLAVISIIYGALLGRRPARHQAADRLRVVSHFGLHHPGHLRDDHPGPERPPSTWSTTASPTAALMLCGF